MVENDDSFAMLLLSDNTCQRTLALNARLYCTSTATNYTTEKKREGRKPIQPVMVMRRRSSIALWYFRSSFTDASIWRSDI